MKASELRALSKEDLLKKERDLREELFRLRLQHSIRRIDNPAKLKALRRDIARIKTVVRELERQ